METSTFGSELVAMRIAKELTAALRHKLRMFGVPLRDQLMCFVMTKVW